MRPGQLHPNELEKALLERLASENPDAQISIAQLHVLSRKFTGVGCFTEFLVKGQPPALRRVLELAVHVTIPGLQHGLGVVAFREEDKLTLELYSFGDEMWDGVFDGFAVHPAV